MELRPLINDLVDNKLCILVSDKEGLFVVPEGLFCQKASAAINKSFKQVDVVLKKVKERAMKLCDSLALKRPRGQINPKACIWTCF